MASGDISIDADQTIAYTRGLRDYADRTERYGLPNPDHVAQVNRLGDLYAPFKDAWAQCQAERTQAYQRVAAMARDLATKGEATLQAFTETDATGAASLHSVAD